MIPTPKDPDLEELLAAHRSVRAREQQIREDAKHAEALQQLDALARDRAARKPMLEHRVKVLGLALEEAKAAYHRAAVELENECSSWTVADAALRRTLASTLPAVLKTEISYYDQRIADEQARTITGAGEERHRRHVASLQDARDAVLQLAAAPLDVLPKELSRIRGTVAPRAEDSEKPAATWLETQAAAMRATLAACFNPSNGAAA